MSQAIPHVVKTEVREKIMRLAALGHSEEDATTALRKAFGDEFKARDRLEAALAAQWGEMGFDEAAGRAALERSGGHVAAAIKMLESNYSDLTSFLPPGSLGADAAAPHAGGTMFVALQQPSNPDGDYSTLPMSHNGFNGGGGGGGGDHYVPIPTVRSGVDLPKNPHYADSDMLLKAGRNSTGHAAASAGLAGSPLRNGAAHAAPAAAVGSPSNMRTSNGAGGTFGRASGQALFASQPRANGAAAAAAAAAGGRTVASPSPPLNGSSSTLFSGDVPALPVSAQRLNTPFRAANKGAPMFSSSPTLGRDAGHQHASPPSPASLSPSPTDLQARAVSERRRTEPTNPLTTYVTMPQRGDLLMSAATEFGTLVSDEELALASLCQSCRVNVGTHHMGKPGEPSKLMCQACVLENITGVKAQPAAAAAAAGLPKAQSVQTPLARRMSAASPAAAAAVAAPKTTVCEWCIAAPATAKVMFDDGRHPLQTCTPCNRLLTDNPNAARPAAPPPTMAAAPSIVASTPPVAAAPPKEMCEHCRCEPIVAKVIFEDGRPGKRTCGDCTTLLTDNPDAPPPKRKPLANSNPGPVLNGPPMPVRRDANGNVVPSAVREDGPGMSVVPGSNPLLIPRVPGPNASKFPTPSVYMDREIDLSLFDWFHGMLQKDEADVVLAEQPVGAFLVRNRPSRHGEFVLVWKEDKKPKPTHILVQPVVPATAEARYQVQAVDNAFHVYPTLLKVVKAYTRKHMKICCKVSAAVPHDGELLALRRNRGD